MASLNPPIVEHLSQLILPRHAIILGLPGVPGGREVLLAKRDGMHLDVGDVGQLYLTLLVTLVLIVPEFRRLCCCTIIELLLTASFSTELAVGISMCRASIFYVVLMKAINNTTSSRRTAAVSRLYYYRGAVVYNYYVCTIILTLGALLYDNNSYY